jgi:hypothetical protein
MGEGYRRAAGRDNGGWVARLKQRPGGANRHAMSDTPPDRLSVDPSSPYYDAEVLARGVGIRFKGEEKTNVDEYCVSEGWVRLVAGNAKDRRGQPLTLKLQGPVEPYFKDAP